VATIDLSVEHTYRVEHPGGSDSVLLFIDDNLVAVRIPRQEAGYNGFNWGDGKTPSGNSADVEWNWIRVMQSAPCSAVAYGQAKVNSLGCTPAIGYSGFASASSGSPFLITAGSIINNKPGILRYCFASAQRALIGGGTGLVAEPLTRSPVQFSGGSLGARDCSGSFSFDFNALIRSGADPRLVPGATIYCQYYYFDTLSPGRVGLSDALCFTICP